MRLTDYRRFACLTTTSSPRGRLTVFDGHVPAELDVVGLRRHPGDMLTGLALEADEVEVLRHLPVLTEDLVRDHREVVRVEIAADVRVRKQARVGRVADALEAVELEAPDRVDVPELVGEKDPAAGARDPGELRDHELRPSHVVEHTQAGREGEGP